MEDHKQPLLLPYPAADKLDQSRSSGGDGDIPPITTLRDFCREFYAESVKLWFLAGPAIFTSVCQYSLGAITQIFAGRVGTLELAAVSVENSVIAGFSLGTMLGMGSALETLCGQAYGAGQLDMLGVYMQRSWVILLATSAILSLMYIFATPFLLLLGQAPSISRAAGIFSIWMLPQLFAYALNFPMAKFLQAQSKMMVMAGIATAALALHALFSWLLILKLGWGLAGAAVVLNASCLEIWYFMALILFAGYLKDAEVSVAALSICMNILGWTIMAAFGMNAAISVRISNELGAGHPRTAKFALMVAVISSFIVGFALAVVLVVTRDYYPSLFSNDSAVKLVVSEMTPLLALCIVINNVQPVLSGVAIGAGWQAAVAYVNIGCYYVFGIPLGLILGYKIEMGVSGIWYGMMAGTVVQTLVLYFMIYKTNWNTEASIAEDRIKQWGGDDNPKLESH
ncbi:Protein DETOXIFICATION 29 [Linum perenne]